MNILKVFKALDSINESASLDAYKQALADIDKLDAEISVLQKEKSDSWTADYEKKFEAERKRLEGLRRELDELLRTYKTKYYTEWDNDGDPVNFDYHINAAEEKSASIIEASLRAGIAKLETEYHKLRTQAEQDHAKAFAIHSQSIKDKSAAIDTLKSRKEALLKAVIAEERPELEKLVAKIQELVNVTPDWEHMTIHQNKLVLSLASPEKTYDVNPEYDLDYDDDGATVNISRIESNLQDDVFESGYFYELAESLGINENAVDEAKSGDLLSIPDSDWKLDIDFDLDFEEPEVHSYNYTPATYWDPAEEDIDYDESFDWKVINYLVKEI